MDNREYTQQLQKRRRVRTIRNTTVFAVLLLIFVGLFVIKFMRENGAAENGTSITETIEQ